MQFIVQNSQNLSLRALTTFIRLVCFVAKNWIHNIRYNITLHMDLSSRPFVYSFHERHFFVVQCLYLSSTFSLNLYVSKIIFRNIDVCVHITWTCVHFESRCTKTSEICEWDGVAGAELSWKFLTTVGPEFFFFYLECIYGWLGRKWLWTSQFWNKELDLFTSFIQSYSACIYLLPISHIWV